MNYEYFKLNKKLRFATVLKGTIYRSLLRRISNNSWQIIPTGDSTKHIISITRKQMQLSDTMYREKWALSREKIIVAKNQWKRGRKTSRVRFTGVSARRGRTDRVI